MLDSNGEAKAQQYIDTLWSSCNFSAKGFSKPSACYYPFEKDLDAKNAQGQFAVGQWIVSKVEYLHSRVGKMELKDESHINSALETSKKELAEVNEDAAEGEGGSCWPRDSKVMRYDESAQDY